MIEIRFQRENIPNGIVSVGVIFVDCPLTAIVRIGHSDSIEQVLLDELCISLSRHSFDDQTQQEKCGVVVDLLIAGLEIEWFSTEQLHQFLAGFFEHLEISKFRKLRVSLDSRCVVQEMPNRDMIALRWVVRKEFRHLVCEGKLPL